MGGVVAGDLTIEVDVDVEDDPALVIRVLVAVVAVVDVTVAVGVVVAPGDEEGGVVMEEEDAVDADDTGPPVEDVDEEVRGGLLDRSRKEAKVLTLNRLLRLDFCLRGATAALVVELVVAVSELVAVDDEDADDEGGVLSAVEKSVVGEEDDEGGEVEGEERVEEEDEEEFREDLRWSEKACLALRNKAEVWIFNDR